MLKKITVVIIILLAAFTLASAQESPDQGQPITDTREDIQLKKNETSEDTAGPAEKQNITEKKKDEPVSTKSKNRELTGSAIGFTQTMLYAMGSFSEMGRRGYGGCFYYTKNDLFIKNSVIGFELGSFDISEADPEDIGLSEKRMMNLVTFGAKAGYMFMLNEKLALIPSVTLGGAYLNITYFAFNSGSGLYDDEVTAKGFAPAASLALALNWYAFHNIYLGVGGNYGLLYHSGSPLTYAGFGVKVGIRF